VRPAVLALCLTGCALGRGWNFEESCRIDQAMSAPSLPAKEDPAVAGLALGAEARVSSTPLSASPGYALTPSSERRPTRSGSAPPRGKSGSGRGSRPKR